MPHVYISTCSFGSNGTTARRAVSYRRIDIDMLGVNHAEGRA